MHVHVYVWYTVHCVIITMLKIHALLQEITGTWKHEVKKWTYKGIINCTYTLNVYTVLIPLQNSGNEDKMSFVSYCKLIISALMDWLMDILCHNRYVYTYDLTLHVNWLLIVFPSIRKFEQLLCITVEMYWALSLHLKCGQLFLA